MPTTYASDAERAANRQALYNMMANAQASPYYATSGGWYGNPMYNAPVYNNQPLAAHQASGAHYSAPGSREGWEEVGAPPVIYQRSPYATAAFRVTPNPWGGASVAPLVGFPSRYPHVVSGVPMQPGSLAMSVAAPYIMRPPAPARQPAAGGGGGNRRRPTLTDPGMKSAHTRQIADPGMRAAHTPPAPPAPPAQPVDWNDPVQTSHHRDALMYPSRPGEFLGVPMIQPPAGTTQTLQDPGMARASAPVQSSTTTQVQNPGMARASTTVTSQVAQPTGPMSLEQQATMLENMQRAQAAQTQQRQTQLMSDYARLLRADRGY